MTHYTTGYELGLGLLVVSQNGVPIGNFRPNIVSPSVLRLTVLSTNRVILRLSTVDSTSDCLIYYLSSYACCDHTTHLSTVDSTSDYFPDSKLSMYVLCYWLSVVNEKAAHTPDSTSDCLIYYQVMLPGICVVIMIKCERFYSYLLCFLD